ncbi:MAG: hypothetical protein ACR2OO_01955 [Thermomicrobiales bacterium]
MRHADQVIDAESVTVGYDSDALMIHLFGRGVPAVSLLITDELMVRWDRANERVVGFQLDHFLSRVAPEHPELLDLLDIADLDGIGVEDVGRIRREIASRHRGSLVNRAFTGVDTMTTAAD